MKGRDSPGDLGGTGQSQLSLPRCFARSRMTLGFKVGALGGYSSTTALLNVEDLGHFSDLQ